MSLLRFLLKRALSLLITLFIITAVLYASVMLTPPETRAELYASNSSPHQSAAQYANMIQILIRKNHLNDPYPVQYFYWVKNLLQGNWGYSPSLQMDVLQAIIERTPVTAELTLYSLILFIPLGVISGMLAGTKKNKLADHSFRLAAYIATSLPPFILALVLLAIFYVNLYWFAPERISSALGLIVRSNQFHTYTGMLTIDGLLNGRPDITLDALRHLVMPVFTLSIFHWATLGRITRQTAIEENQQDYVVAARSRGLSERQVTWRHIFPNTIAPALTSSMLSAAALITGVYVVEIIFNFPGISWIAVRSFQLIPDAPAALGFAIYTVIVVLILMFILDFFQIFLDPRVREEM